MSQQIKTIIFDLGGVILNIDYQKTEQAFKALGFENFAELYTQFKQTELFVQLEKGKLSREAFLKRLAAYHPSTVSHQQMIAAWNAMLLDIPQTSLDFLKSVKPHYRIFLLSNTNEIHYEAFHNHIELNIGSHYFNSLFEATYYSHHIGLRKPESKAFEHVLHGHNLNPRTTLFIEDSPQHIEAARQVGLQTFYKTSDATWEDVVKAFNLVNA